VVAAERLQQRARFFLDGVGIAGLRTKNSGLNSALIACTPSALWRESCSTVAYREIPPVISDVPGLCAREIAWSSESARVPRERQTVGNDGVYRRIKGQSDVGA
jgi:hypothetical protein